MLLPRVFDDHVTWFYSLEPFLATCHIIVNHNTLGSQFPLGYG